LMASDFDSVVVGAGVIGLAVARQFAMAGHKVLVLEKAASIGTETSSRNSEVIHAGIYYPKGSLKARLCVEGGELLFEYCKAHGVAAKRLGKLIVATSTEEDAKLDSIAKLARDNGVTDLQWMSKSEVAELEPELRCTKALYSPSTGIIDAAAFMLSLHGEAEALGVDVVMNAQFSGAEMRDGDFVVKTTDSHGELTEITATQIINCAGHGAHDVARLVDGIEATRLPPRFLAKGSYCSVSGKSPFQHLVYPVPVSGALGIHATLDLSGAVKFGPDITWVDELDYALSPDLPEKFSGAIASYWPGVRDRTLSSSYCGIRPKIHGPDSGFADFKIQREDEHGVEGLVNLFGIESPGLTASLAIAKHIVETQQRSEPI
jgi:L-2-hydroxyglutarate oxidase LhgO